MGMRGRRGVCTKEGRGGEGREMGKEEEEKEGKEEVERK